MQPPWKLVVEDLGRIARAEIEARPLLLFVGGNNTGKTYLASMLWGLLSLTWEPPIHRAEAFQRCLTWFEERYVRREQEPEFKITPEVYADLVETYQGSLREHGAALVASVFNRPKFDVGKIELRDIARRLDVPMRWQAPLYEQRSFGAYSVQIDEREWVGPVDDDAATRLDLGTFALLITDSPDAGETEFYWLSASCSSRLLACRPWPSMCTHLALR